MIVSCPPPTTSRQCLINLPAQPDHSFLGTWALDFRPSVYCLRHMDNYLISAYHSHFADLYNSCHSKVTQGQTFRQEKDQWMCSTEPESNTALKEKYSSLFKHFPFSHLSQCSNRRPEPITQSKGLLRSLQDLGRGQGPVMCAVCLHSSLSDSWYPPRRQGLDSR